ncbi:hypothetical protein GN241_11135 [Rhodobacteraceae bacterium IMCC1335]
MGYAGQFDRTAHNCCYNFNDKKGFQMKWFMVMLVLLTIPSITLAEQTWEFDPTDSFRICHERALKESPQPSTDNIDLTSCIATQELAHRTSARILVNLHGFENPMLESLIPACNANKKEPTNWVSAFECLTALQEAGGWEEEMPHEEGIREFIGNRDNLLNMGVMICIKHPRYGRYASAPAGSNGYILFLGACVNGFANALEEWDF